MQDPNREKELFNQALDITDPTERQAFLRRECGDETALLQRLQALLAANDAATAFMPNAPRQTIRMEPEQFPSERPGALIGRYKIMERVGEGGCGVVYVAEQTEPVRRRVALKVIKLGMDTKSVVARFEAERQALAMMDHPNIARVLDAGATELGRPYFVMELVRGIPITHYCDQNNLGTKERLGLFIQICQAIQHAHQKGIIHRDIKPSNILVTVNDGVPVPKVIDFGIAKATEGRLTDNTVYTQLHQFIGTPAYMSPEQAEMTSLDIDTRSDIYSLGVLLYELLAGRTPFEAKELMAAGLDAMRKTIREREPARPSTRVGTLRGEELSTTAKRRSTEAPKLLRQLQGDLDWIVMKCLEKDRTRRYETANGLAMDIRRHLDNEAVSAAAPSLGYRMGKFARRYRVALSAVAGILIVLFCATVFSVLQAARSRRLAESEQRQRQAATLAQQEAEAVTAFLSQALASADPYRLGRDVTVRQVLDQAAMSLSKSFADRPLLEARLHETIGETYFGLGLYEPAEKHLVAAEATRSRLLGETAEPTWRVRTLLADLLGKKGDPKSAEGMIRKVLELERKNGAPKPELLAASLRVLGASLLFQGRYDEAIPVHQEAIAAAEAAYGPWHFETVRVKNNLGVCYSQMEQYHASVPIHREVVAKSGLPANHPLRLAALSNLASAEMELGSFGAAEGHYRDYLQTAQPALGEKHPDYLRVQAQFAYLLAVNGEPVKARDLLREVDSSTRQALGEAHLITIMAQAYLATALSLCGEHAQATRLGEDTVAKARQFLLDDAFQAEMGVQFSGVLLAAQRPADAQRAAEEALGQLASVPDRLHYLRSRARRALAKADEQQGQFERAEIVLTDDYSILTKLPAGFEHPKGLTADALISLYQRWGRPEKAAEWRSKRSTQAGR